MSSTPPQTLAIATPHHEKAAKIDGIADQFLAESRTNGAGGFGLALRTAEAMSQIRGLLTPDMMKPVMELMNSPLGFLTDKDPNKPVWKNGHYETAQPYSVEVVRDCVIEARLRGLHLVGNQFNIIGGRAYVTKEGFKNNLLRNLPGLTDLKIIPGIPKLAQSGEGAFVEMKATWKINGTPQDLSLTLAIRVNKNMGTDAILGKADRKMRAAIYGQITGSEVTDGDISDDTIESMRPVTGTVIHTDVPPVATSFQKKTVTEPAPKGAEGASAATPPAETPLPEATATAEPHEPKPAPGPERRTTTEEGVRNLSEENTADSEPVDEFEQMREQIRTNMADSGITMAELTAYMKANKYATKPIISVEAINPGRLQHMLDNWSVVVRVIEDARENGGLK